MYPISVSVVVPARNESACIGSNLRKIACYLTSRFVQWEVIVVDDGSVDDTPKKILEVGNEIQQVRPVWLPRNRGKGFAVMQGVLRAEGDVILFTDADLSTSVEAIEEAIAKLSEDYPVVIGSRRHSDSTIPVQQGWLREKMGVAFNLFLRLLLPLPFKDTQCGFKCFTRKAAKEIFSRARIDGFAFDAEVLLIAERLGYPVKEIAVCWSDSPKSSVNPVRELLPVIRDLLMIYRNDRRGLYSSNTTNVGQGIRDGDIAGQ